MSIRKSSLTSFDDWEPKRNANGAILPYPNPAEQVRILRRALESSLATLWRIEWRGLAGQEFCWLCDRMKKDGHAPACPIASAIAEAKRALEETGRVGATPCALEGCLVPVRPGSRFCDRHAQEEEEEDA